MAGRRVVVNGKDVGFIVPYNGRWIGFKKLNRPGNFADREFETEAEAEEYVKGNLNG